MQARPWTKKQHLKLGLDKITFLQLQAPREDSSLPPRIQEQSFSVIYRYINGTPRNQVWGRQTGISARVAGSNWGTFREPDFSTKFQTTLAPKWVPFRVLWDLRVSDRAVRIANLLFLWLSRSFSNYFHAAFGITIVMCWLVLYQSFLVFLQGLKASKLL